jgi:hypothetical protein
VDQTSKPTRSFAWLKWLVFILLLLASLGLAFWLLPSASLNVQARIDALKKAGYPVTAQDLDKMYPPLPDDQNSVVIYQRAFSNFVQRPKNATNWPFVYSIPLLVRNPPRPGWANQLPTDVKQAIANYLTQNEGTLDLLHQANSIQKGYYDIGFKNGFSNVEFKPFFQISDNAQLLALATFMHCEEGRPDLAAQTTLDSLGLARSLEHAPLISWPIARDHCLGLTASSLRLTLNKIQLSDEELESLAATFHEAEAVDTIKLWLICDRCQAIAFHDEISRKSFLHRKDLSLSRKFSALVYYFQKYRESGYLFYLEMMDKYIGASDMPYPDRLEVAKQLDLKAAKSSEFERGFAEMLFEDWHGRFVIEARTRADLLLSETALAIERYRLANQYQLPAALQDLVPAYLTAVAADPFDGKPLRFNRLPKGYLIYSIGEDGVDNGGREWNPDTKTGDITFTVER